MKLKALIFLVLCIAGAGLYFGGTHGWDSFTFSDQEGRRIQKKISAVKPKNFHSKRNKFRRASIDDNFSFFTVLNDPSMSKMVDLKGEVYRNYRSQPVQVASAKVRPAKKMDASYVPVVKTKVKQASAVIEAPRLNTSLLKVKPYEIKKVETARSVERQLSEFLAYAVQVSSFRQLERAEMLKGQLAKKGYASFIGKTELPNNKGTWHRVYIGRYLDRAKAEVAAARVQREEKLQAMVIKRQPS